METSPEAAAHAETPAGRTTVVHGGLLLMLSKLVHVIAGFGLFFFLSDIFQRTMGVNGSAAFGMYGTLLLIVNPLNMMFAQGTLQVVSRAVASRPDLDPADVFRACARAQLPFVIGFLVLFQLAVPSIAEHFLNDPSYELGLRLGGVIPFFYAIRCLYQGYCNGSRRFREQSWIDMGSSLLRMLLVLGGAALGFGVLGALSGFVSAALIMMVVAAMWIRPATSRVGARLDGRGLFSFQGKVLAVALISSALMSLDQLAVKALADADPQVADRLAGYFTGCQKIAQIPWGIILALVWVLFPLVAEDSGNLEGQRATLRKGFRLILLLLVPVCAVLMSTAPETYGLVFSKMARSAVDLGDPASVVSGPLTVMAGGYFFFGLLIVASMLITAQGRAGTTLLIMLATLVLCRWLTTAWVVEYGSMGAAYGSASGWAVGMLAALAVLVRSHGAIVSVVSVVRILLAGGVVCLVARLVPGEGLLLLPRVALLGAAYAGVILISREVRVTELKDLLRAVRRQ